jgi:MFS family permease
MPREFVSASYAALLLIVCLIAFAAYLGSYMRLPVVPLFALSLGASTTEVGLINATFLFMAGVLSLPLGILSDRWGRKPLAIAGLILSMVTAALLCFGRTPWQLLAIYFFFGISLAAVGPTLMSYVADLSPPTHLGRSYGWYTTAIYGGMSLGPGLGGFVAHAWGFRPLFLLTAAFMFVTVWAAGFLLPRGGAAHSSWPYRRGDSARVRDLLKNRPLLVSWFAVLLSSFGVGMFITFCPLHAHQHGLNLRQIGLIFMVQAVCSGLSRLPFGRLSDRVGRRGGLASLGLLGIGASLVGFALSQTLVYFLLSGLSLGVSMGLFFTSSGALSAELVPPEAKGLSMGGFSSCIYLGQMVSSAVMGGVITMVGFSISFLLSGVLILLVALFFYRLIKV